MMGLPPATCGQVSEVPIVNAKPLSTPMMPPISTHTRTGLLGSSSASRIFSLGIGAKTRGLG